MAEQIVVANKPQKNEDGSKMLDADTGKQINKTVKIAFDFKENLPDAVKAFGEKVVYTSYLASAVIDLQGRMRAGLEKGLEPDEVVASLAEWKPGVQAPRTVDPMVGMIAQFKSGMSDEDKKKKLNALIAAAGLKG